MPTNFNYIRNIPFATNNPSADQPNMLTNTNSTDSIIGVDHLTFGTATGILSDGYHKIIHEDPSDRTRATVAGVDTLTNFPANIVGVNQVFAASYTPDTTGGAADTQLFTTTGNGGVSQLTGNFATSEGWCWFGGILIQWGTVTGLLNVTHQTGGVTFKDRVAGTIRFPNNCFNVQATLIPSNAATTAARATISISSISATAFAYVLNMADNAGGSRFPSFYWMAVGN